MQLLVDIGNTRIRWCGADAGRMTGTDCIDYTRDGLDMLNEAWSALDTPQSIIVSNVAGQSVAEIVQEVAHELWHMEARFITAQSSACGVTNGYTHPEHLGADRWAALIAAYHQYNGPCCVVDCGTAVTLDIVDRHGAHLGGLILPGLAMMRHALLSGTSDLSLNNEHAAPNHTALLADDTSDGVKAGTFYTLIAALDRITADLEEELDCRLQRVITGGDAELLLPLLGQPHHHEPDLVLKGLSLLSETPP